MDKGKKMNYEKVYSSFIKDRKLKEKKLIESGKYKESHHILPKSKGGTNKKINLIYLTAEDHIRAHLLLAKIYGGKMWSPIFYIIGNKRKKRIPTKREIRIASFAKEMFSKQNSGLNNPSTNKTKIHFIHISGKTEYMALVEFAKKYGYKRETVWNMVYKKSMYLRGYWTASTKMTLQQFRKYIVKVNDEKKININERKVYVMKIPGDNTKRINSINIKNIKEKKYGIRTNRKLEKIQWVNLGTGDSEILSSSEMKFKYGGNDAQWSNAKNGKLAYKNWVNIKYKNTTKKNTKKHKKMWYFNENGDKFFGTQSEFVIYSGISVGTASMISNKKQAMSRCRWYIDYKFKEEVKLEKKKRGQEFARRNNIPGSNRKKIICEETGDIYNSIEEANRIHNVKNIGKVVRGERKKCGGLSFRYC